MLSTFLYYFSNGIAFTTALAVLLDAWASDDWVPFGDNDKATKAVVSIFFMFALVALSNIITKSLGV